MTMSFTDQMDITIKIDEPTSWDTKKKAIIFKLNELIATLQAATAYDELGSNSNDAGQIQYEMYDIESSSVSNITYFPIADFRAQGFLQEANRLFFHLHGLALEVSITPSGEKLKGIWDYRTDPEGILYGWSALEDPASTGNAKIIADLAANIAKVRLENYGFTIQPVGIKQT